MGAEVDGICGATHGERSPERINHRDGYRTRRWDTRVSSIGLAIPKLRQGSYFPDSHTSVVRWWSGMSRLLQNFPLWNSR